MFTQINRIISLIIDLIYPQGTLVAHIENVDTNTFTIRAKKSYDVELSTLFPIYSLFSYKDNMVRTAIQQVKYHKNKKIIRLLAQVLKNSLFTELEDEIIYSNFVNPIIVPIPSHKKKKRQKGFNQTEEILYELEKISDMEIFSALYKIKEHGDQTKKDRTSRLNDMVGCFSVKKDFESSIRNRNVIIFDDVITTGGTMIEAHRVLKKAGARRVVGFALAH